MTQITYYVRRVRELGFRESIHQATNIVTERASARIKRIRDRYLNVTEEKAADRLLQRLFRQHDFARQIKTRATPRFFLDHEPAFYLNAIRAHSPEMESKIIAAADRIRNRTFDLLGSGPKDLKDLPWQVDFKSGYAWDPKEHYRHVRYGNIPGVDVKLPWELSRFQHAILLGQAYWLTGNEQYTIEFKNQFLDWIEKNPCKYGVNWACTMDVGIRAVNWIWAFYFFRGSPAVDARFVRTFLRALYLHARFIRSNLEYRTTTIDGHDRRLPFNNCRLFAMTGLPGSSE